MQTKQLISLKLSLILILLFAAVCIGLWLADNPNSTDHTPKTLDRDPVKTTKSSPEIHEEIALAKTREAHTSTIQDKLENPRSGSVHLLSQFEATGDLKWLKEAQRLHPNDPQVVLFSAVFATDINDKWLKRLEEMQPNNGLPKIIRASLYAEQGHAEAFRSELLKALSKEKWDTRSRERLASKLDAIIQSGEVPQSSILSYLDLAYFGKVMNMVQAVGRTPNLVGGQEEAEQLSLAVAQRLREQGTSFDMTSKFAGHAIELEILMKYKDDDLYGTEGMTILDRRNEIEEFGEWYHNKVLPSVYKQLVNNPSSNPSLSLQFFARIRADGEMAAVRWLLKQKIK